MSAREELAKMLFVTDNHNATGADAEWEFLQQTPKYLAAYHQMADAILAAGYSKPRQVSTVEELDALPDESVIKVRSGQVWEAAKLTDGENIWRTFGPAKVLSSEVLGRWSLPATVLYEPGQS